MKNGGRGSVNCLVSMQLKIDLFVYYITNVFYISRLRGYIRVIYTGPTWPGVRGVMIDRLQYPGCIFEAVCCSILAVYLRVYATVIRLYI